MNAKPQQLFRPLRPPWSASQIRTAKKDRTKSNLPPLPQIQNIKDASRKSNKTPSMLASSSSSSLSSATSRARKKKVDDLANQLLKCTIQSTANMGLQSRSYRTGNEPISVEGIAGFIRTGLAKRIVVMTGAGISTPSGIPDFRTPGTGLYDNLKQYNIPYPEAIFEISYFHRNPKPFFTLAKELYPNGKYQPNYVHYFLRALHDKGLLLRLYTQNIDGLERSAGIPPSKLVEAHGTFMAASCTACHAPHTSEYVRAAIFSDKIPRCNNLSCRGMVKPDIVFFEEQLPARFYMYNKDFHEADLLLILGTSLEVRPFADIADCVRLNVPRLLFNRDLVGPFHPKLRRRSDVASTGDITEEVKKFVDLLGWTQDLDKLIANSDQPKQVATERTAEATGTNQGPETNSAIATQTNKETVTEIPPISSNTKKNDVLERNETEKNKKTSATSISTLGNKSRNNPSSFSTVATNKKRLIPFHAQKELYRSNRTAPESNSDDLSSSSSDDD